MKQIYLTLLILSSFVILIRCSAPEHQGIPYPVAPPQDSIMSYLPGIVCTGGDSVDFNAAFSPDGTSFYFTRSQNRRWDIYVSAYDGSAWRKGVKVSFDTDQYSEADPAFGPDGSLYFISNMPRNNQDTLADFDIWFVKPLSNGNWTAPENLTAVNSDSTEYYVSFTKQGDLYFASSRLGGYGLEDVYISHNTNGTFGLPENLGPAINTPYSDHDACLPVDGRYMIYTTVDRPGDAGEGDLYVSQKDSKGQWTAGVRLNARLNTPTYEYCSYFSPDGKYFFYSSRRDVKWMDVETLDRIVLNTN